MNQNQGFVETPEDVVVGAIKKKLESLTSLSTNSCIYKIPERLRRLNRNAYSPRILSIGPLHRGETELEAMEDQKLRYLESFLSRTPLSLNDLVIVAKEWEERALSCYTEVINLKSDEFVKMLIVDASFLVELLLRSQYDKDMGLKDIIFGKPRMIVDVNHDIMLLENQLPYFVVEKMFGLLHDDHRRGRPPLTQIIYSHFQRFWVSMPLLWRQIYDSEICHLVDLLRIIHLPMELGTPGGTMRSMDSILSAKEIQNAGVKLQPANNNTCALDITFANGVLTIPRIKIHDITEALYRNIIVFEQSHRTETYFTHYMKFISCFIRSPKDVELFMEHGIIVNRRGNAEDVSRMFNSILKETSGGGFYYQKMYENLEAYCNKRLNRWRGTLRHDYFKNPCSTLSIVAASFLLLLTFIQSVCSIIALFLKK